MVRGMTGPVTLASVRAEYRHRAAEAVLREFGDGPQGRRFTARLDGLTRLGAEHQRTKRRRQMDGWLAKLTGHRDAARTVTDHAAWWARLRTLRQRTRELVDALAGDEQTQITSLAPRARGCTGYVARGRADDALDLAYGRYKTPRPGTRRAT